MKFANHAVAPPGNWVNDPNGLVFSDGQWRLFVQHSAAAPDFKSIGWARLSSADLIHWTWDGPVIPPDALGQAYSGSIVADDDNVGISAFLTRHDGKLQRQVELTSKDAGVTWQQGEPLGPEGRNVRDPFVFFCVATNDWRMIIAEPCDWTDWATTAPSTLSIWRRDGTEWHFVARIGPWVDSGILWEIPVLVDFGAYQALIISTVDRQQDSADCAVRYWLGHFDGVTFESVTPNEGLLLDHGPDFYAAIVDSPQSDIRRDRKLVAWASSWATAREMPWPGGVHGGPITLPRKLSLDTAKGRLTQKPINGVKPAKSYKWDGCSAMTIEITGDDALLSLVCDEKELHVRRHGLGTLLDWTHRNPNAFSHEREQTIHIFNDAGLIEAFFEPAGLTVTAFVPGARL